MNIPKLMISTGLIIAVGLWPNTVVYADTFSISSSNGVTQDSRRSSGPLPKRNGSYRLKAFADTSATPMASDPAPKTGAYTDVRPPLTFRSDTLDALDTGIAFNPQAHAEIRWNNSRWSSANSFARLNPQGIKNPGETARARWDVTDPWFWDPFLSDEVLTFVVTFGAGMSIAALLDSGDSASATITGNATTDLNGLGELWRFTWSTDSSNPGIATFNLVSNLFLGLDDVAIESDFVSKLISDPGVGSSTLGADVSFTFDLTIPANTTPEFSGTISGSAEAQTVPEPATIVLFGIGLAGLGFTVQRRKRAA